MPETRKPKIGLLGLMTDGYESVFPGIIERQCAYAREIVDAVSGVVDIDFPGPGLNRASIEQRMREFNAGGYDGVLIVLLAYSHGAWLLRALQDNRLPIALAVVQPDQAVANDWDELRLTVNQGVHGAQDNANVIVRNGFSCQFFAGDRTGPGFGRFVGNFGKACLTRTMLRAMRVGIVGRMHGMGDILADDMQFFAKIGPEFRHDGLGAIASRMKKVTKNDIDARIARDAELHDVDPNLGYDSHAEAVRMYFGFRRYLEDYGYQAFTAHFDLFGEDGRFRQLPLYAASNLMAEGYGYAAEGDAMCASMVAAAHALGDNDGNFTEMYTMDHVTDSIIFCHAGEGNWATARADTKVRLIDRYLGEGGLDNPPTHIFTPKPGPATLTSLAALEGGKFRLVAAQGEILPRSDMRNCEMPYIFWRPEAGVGKCVENWLRNGGTHHEVISLGDLRIRWKMLCDMLRIEYAEI